MPLAVSREYETATISTLFIRTFLPFALVFTLLVGGTVRMLYEGNISLLKNNELALLERSLLGLQKNLEVPQEHLLSLQQEQPIRSDLKASETSGLKSMENSFASLLNRNANYAQVRWIDQEGQERLRVEPIANERYGYHRVPDDALQNKINRYYVQETMTLENPLQLYISPIDLNVEHGEIERPFRPMLRMAAQLWDQEQPKGVIVINIDARKYLNDLQQISDQASLHIQLINPNGFWLKHPNPEWEWGFQLSHGQSFSKKFPDVWQQMLNYNQHQVLDSTGLWSWVTLYPDDDPQRFNNQMVGFLLLHQPPKAINNLRLKYWGGGLLILLLTFTLGGAILYRILKAQRAQQLAENQAINDRLKADHLKKQREDEQRFRVIFNASHTPLLVCDSSGNISLVNPALEKLFGYSAFELTGLPVEHLIPVAMRKEHTNQRQSYLNHLRPRRKMMNDGKSLQGLCKNGSLVDVEIGLSPYEHEGVVFILATLEDIGARVRAERQLKEIHERETKHLEKAREEAERLAHLKSHFLANMSHEIRTPLNAIMVLGELVQHETLPENAHSLIRSINSASQNLLYIVNDVLDFSKIEAGGLTIEQSPFSIQMLLTQIQAITEVPAKQKGLKLHFNTGGSERLTLLGDLHRLKQVLLNLISNGIKFTDQGKVSLHIQKQAQTSSHITLRFSVSDTGRGIPEDQRSVIFDAFAQADNSITRKFGGTGLGLAISQELTQRMGGELLLTSKEGHGSCFFFTLTFPTTTEKSLAAEPSLVSFIPKGLLKGQTLLVVDDSDINRDIAQRIIERAAGKAIIAKNGQVALDILRQKNPPDISLVLMDLQMPVLDGYETTRKLHQIPKYRYLPVVALTAGVTENAEAEAIAAGAIKLLTKPFTIEQIVACFNELLAKDKLLVKDSLLTKDNAIEHSPVSHDSPISTPVLETMESSVHTLSECDSLLDEKSALINWGDKATLQRFLAQFVEQYSTSDTQIQNLIKTGRIKQAEKLAHKAKGTAASLYLMALQSEFSRIESDLKQTKETDKLEYLSLTLAKTLDTITQYRRK